MSAQSLQLTSPAAWRHRRVRSALEYTVLLTLATVAGAFVPGPLADLVLPTAALAVAYSLLRREAYGAYLELSLWLFVLSPWLRRVVDLLGTFHAQSATLIAPNLVALLALPVAWRHRQQVVFSARVAFVAAFAAVGYAAVVGLALNPPMAVLAGILIWLPPLSLGFFVLMAPIGWPELRELVLRFALLATLLLSVYGIVQWFTAPAWDTNWLQSIGDAGESFGQPHPFELRIWSLSNGPGAFAGLLVMLLVVLTATRLRHPGWLRWLAFATGVVALGLSSVRAAWIGAILTLPLLAWRGNIRLLRVIAIGAVMLVALSIVSAPISSQITDRVSGLTEGGGDQSGAARLTFQASALPQALEDPTGRGLGSTGAGVRASDEAQRDAFANTDSGYLEVLRTFGSVPGSLLLLAVLTACLTAYRRARKEGPLFIAWAALLATTPIAMLFGNAIGLATWIGLGIVGRLHSREEDAPPTADS